MGPFVVAAGSATGSAQVAASAVAAGAIARGDQTGGRGSVGGSDGRLLASTASGVATGNHVHCFGGLGGGRLGSCRGRRRAWVVASVHEGLQNDEVVCDLNRVVGGVLVRVLVALGAGGLDARGSVVAVDGNLGNQSTVHTVGHVLAVPVDLTTSPINSSLAVRRETSRPERKHDAGGCLRVVEASGGSVPGVGALLGAADLAVDRPGKLVLLPVDAVLVSASRGVRNAELFHVVV